MKKNIVPDINSWISDSFINFAKLIKNEFDLTLFDALNEYVNYHTSECAYMGPVTENTELTLYPKFSFEIKERKATLNRLFFVCERALHILCWNYLLDDKNKKILSKFNLLDKKIDDNFPLLNFFSTWNNLEIFEAKETLLKYSYQRNSLKSLLSLENDTNGYGENSLNVAIITFDLNFLKTSSFFVCERYKSFQKILSPNLLLEIPVCLEQKSHKIPEEMKEEQLLKK